MGVTWFRLSMSLFIPSVSDNNTNSFLAMIQVSVSLKNRYSKRCQPYPSPDVTIRQISKCNDGIKVPPIIWDSIPVLNTSKCLCGKLFCNNVTGRGAVVDINHPRPFLPPADNLPVPPVFRRHSWCSHPIWKRSKFLCRYSHVHTALGLRWLSYPSFSTAQQHHRFNRCKILVLSSIKTEVP